MLLDRTKIPLVKEMNYFIYGDSLTGQLYKVFETKQFSMNQHAQLFIYIIAAMIIKQIDRIYIPFSSLFFNIILLVIMMFLIMMRVWQQLKEWENFIVYQIFNVSKIEMKDIVVKAQKNLKSNTILLIVLTVLFIITVLLFICFSNIFFLIISLGLWYVLSLLSLTLHLKERKRLLDNLNKDLEGIMYKGGN